MKTFKIALLTAIVSLPVAANSIDKTWELGIFGDYVKSDTNKEDLVSFDRIEAGKSIGIDLQKIINDSWNIRFEAARTRYDVQNGADKDYGNRTGIDAIYKLPRSDFYLFAGVKRFNNTRSYNAANLGAGYSYELSNRVSAYAEAVVYKDLNFGYVDQGVKLGVKYAFGSEKHTVPTSTLTAEPITSTPVVEFLDQDNDGVSDANDVCANTKNTVKVDSKGCALYSQETVSVDLNVSFANNSSIINKAELSNIQRLADFMSEYKNTHVVIEGHSSAVGTAQYNLYLSQKRADSVRQVLIKEFGINADRLVATGFGESRLLSNGNTLADNQRNRRVVAKIETTKEKAVLKN